MCPYSRQVGSDTAKQGFQNERYVINHFNQWQTDNMAQDWLKILGHPIENILSVRATQVSGSHKADISVAVKEGRETSLHYIQVKLVSNLQGFNQIDKRWIDRYCELWNIPTDIVRLLKLYTGELSPTKRGKDSRRMLADEFEQSDQAKLIKFLSDNKTHILQTILSGDGEQAAQWFLVIQKINNNPKWALWNIEQVISFYGEGEIEVTKKGNFRIGKITMQRKGGDGGRETAKMLQFKINPAAIL
jgi:hypothetical protein